MEVCCTQCLHNEECEEIFIGLLQAGGRAVVSEDSAESTAGPIDQTNIDAAVSANADFLAQFTAAGVCTYAYIGQFTSIASSAIPVLELTTATGVVIEGASL